jgi:hypothetical protein
MLERSEASLLTRWKHIREILRFAQDDRLVSLFPQPASARDSCRAQWRQTSAAWLIQRLIEQGLHSPTGRMARGKSHGPPPVIVPARGVPIPAVSGPEWGAWRTRTRTRQNMRDLLDSSVRLPLTAPDHVHYHGAVRYWDDEATENRISEGHVELASKQFGRSNVQ